MENVLTARDVFGLSNVLRMAESGANVRRLIPDDEPNDGDVVEGVARSVGDTNGGFLRAGQDVRDAFLRVTLLSGFDVYWPVTTLAKESLNGCFAASGMQTKG